MIPTYFDKAIYSCIALRWNKKSNAVLWFAIFVVLFIFGSTGCSIPPDSDFYEVDGLVTGTVTDSVEVEGWTPVYFINSSGLANISDSSSASNSLTYTVYISTPGSYAFWALTAYPGTGNASSKIDISITDIDNFLISRASADIPQKFALKWQRADTGTDSNLITFTDPGQYKISFTAPGSAGIQLHKFQMSLDNADPPYGLGLPSSTRSDLSSADLFRELPVMLPPAWVFNPVIGFDEDRSNALQHAQITEPADASSSAGGIWRLPASDNNVIDVREGEKRGEPAWGIKVNFQDSCVSGSSNLFKQGIRFLFTQNSPGLDCLQRLHQQYQESAGDDNRSVIFHGITNAYNTDIKQYPAPITPEYEFKWSASPRVQDGNFRPGGYAELVDDLSNPAGSLFNMPFLSMPVDYPDGLADGSGWDSELFIRTVQLATFSPVMHLIFPGSVYQLSESESRQLSDAMLLRNSLFPYSYTHAHYTRQSNESIISGFRRYPDQFMYGDAFLAAPVVEPGAEGRIVYFPNGRLWYNYYTNEAFEAGRSWFVETELNRMPLFVKAGSVIPYRFNDDPEQLTIEIYTGDAGAFRLVEDDGTTRAYRRTDAARTMLRYNEVEGNLKFTIGAVQAGFDGMSDYRSYDIYFKHAEIPERIEINSEELVRASASTSSEDESRSWRFDGGKNEIILNLEDVSRYEKLDIVIYL